MLDAGSRQGVTEAQGGKRQDLTPRPMYRSGPIGAVAIARRWLVLGGLVVVWFAATLVASDGRRYCRDGSTTSSSGRGTCSWHKGQGIQPEKRIVNMSSSRAWLCGAMSSFCEAGTRSHHRAPQFPFVQLRRQRRQVSRYRLTMDRQGVHVAATLCASGWRNEAGDRIVERSRRRCAAGLRRWHLRVDYFTWASNSLPWPANSPLSPPSRVDACCSWRH
jgi:hypothetical protein